MMAGMDDSPASLPARHRRLADDDDVLLAVTSDPDRLLDADLANALGKLGQIAVVELTANLGTTDDSTDFNGLYGFTRHEHLRDKD